MVNGKKVNEKMVNGKKVNGKMVNAKMTKSPWGFGVEVQPDGKEDEIGEPDSHE